MIAACNWLEIKGFYMNQKFENSNMRLTRGSGQLNLRTSETRA